MTVLQVGPLPTLRDTVSLKAVTILGILQVDNRYSCTSCVFTALKCYNWPR